MTDRDPSGEQQESPRGLFESLRALMATLAAIAQTRLELLSTEAEEQVAYLASLLVWSIVALFLAFTAIVLIVVAIIIVFWDANRVAVAVGLAVTFAVLALIAFLVLRAQTRNRPRAFQATLEELAKDRERLSDR